MSNEPIIIQVKLVNNRVVTTERITPTALSFDRASGREFYDVRIRSEDGKVFDAHRVVLSARLEYFRAMFSCGWIEVFVVQNYGAISYDTTFLADGFRSNFVASCSFVGVGGRSRFSLRGSSCQDRKGWRRGVCRQRFGIRWPAAD